MKTRILIFLLLLFSANTSAQQKSEHITKSVFELAAVALENTRCMSLQMIGVCPKPTRKPPLGIKIRFWQPELFMETVKMPGDSVIREYGALLGEVDEKLAEAQLKAAFQTDNLKVTSTGSSQSMDSSNLQFNEVHLYDLPSAAVFDEMCGDAPNMAGGIHFVSESNSVVWRRGDIEKKLPQSLLSAVIGSQCHRLSLGATPAQCMKDWGPLYPRQGFVVTQSQAVASIVDALRAVSVAGDTMSPYLKSPLNFSMNMTKDKVQMAYPTQGQCLPIGSDPQQLEADNQSKDGRYVWIYWHQRQCCI